ncbi:hypothetical protein [Enterobacter hormaechei]|jgi:hypothetical protein|uniref:hypothetical protein n=1 Tax=Enterobacter hormaechei TaxID=158836 RepID=UPI002412B98E|nr:hypothetical protein [Enterobacter hormaechei]
MTTDNSIWLEVRRDNGAILSYFLEQPGLPPESTFYIPATKAELAYLNGLEDAILPAGMVATLSDLEAHRSRVEAATKLKAATPTKAPVAAPAKPTDSASKTSKTQPSTDKQRAKASFIAALKQHRSNK